MPDRDPTHGAKVGAIDPDDDDNTRTVRTPRTGDAVTAMDHDDRQVGR